MRVTRRESLRLFGLMATAGSSHDHLYNSLLAQKPLDRAGLLQLLGAVPVAPPPLAAERVERLDLGDLVREKVTYAVEPGERVPAFVLLPKAGSRSAVPPYSVTTSTVANSKSGRTARLDLVQIPTSTMRSNWLAAVT